MLCLTGHRQWFILEKLKKIVQWLLVGSEATSSSGQGNKAIERLQVYKTEDKTHGSEAGSITILQAVTPWSGDVALFD